MLTHAVLADLDFYGYVDCEGPAFMRHWLASHDVCNTLARASFAPPACTRVIDAGVVDSVCVASGHSDEGFNRPSQFVRGGLGELLH